MAGGQERILRGRIRSVQATKKITRAMELIAASRIVKAQQRVAAAVPYSDLIAEVVRDLSQRNVDEHGLSAGEKRMLTRARSILTSEISLSEDISEEEAQRLLDVNLGYADPLPGDDKHHTEAPEEPASQTLARLEAEKKKSKSKKK